MKRVLLGILAAVVVLSVSTTTAFAAGHRGGRYFTDKNGDGICDNASSVCIYVDADADGICDVCSTDHAGCLAGDGAAFIDANGDGICDNCGTYHWCEMTGTGGGGNFVDADGDGICDNYASGQGRGNGQGGGCGFRGGRGR